ncbi:hypothetical protein BGW80DRAFT_1353031 [Lactifluus volemus]|nr:hypothetical protein BGW80DRAFT_1353031 [Lactifluus volemus]
MAITSESQPHDHDRYIHTTSIVTAVAITPTTFAESTNHHVYDGHDHIAITNTTMLTVFAAPTIMTPTTTLRCFPMLRQLEQRSFSLFPAVCAPLRFRSFSCRIVIDSGSPQQKCDGDRCRETQSWCGALPPFLSFRTDRFDELSPTIYSTGGIGMAQNHSSPSGTWKQSGQ